MTAVANTVGEARVEFGSGLRQFLARRDAPADEPPAPPASEAPPADRERTRPYHFAVPALEHEARAFLAFRAEEEAELLWSVFAEALAATTPSGRPDHRTRLLAARTLLAALPGDAPARTRKRARVQDELAELRRRRAGA